MERLNEAPVFVWEGVEYSLPEEIYSKFTKEFVPLLGGDTFAIIKLRSLLVRGYTKPLELKRLPPMSRQAIFPTVYYVEGAGWFRFEDVRELYEFLMISERLARFRRDTITYFGTRLNPVTVVNSSAEYYRLKLADPDARAVLVDWQVVEPPPTVKLPRRKWYPRDVWINGVLHHVTSRQQMVALTGITNIPKLQKKIERGDYDAPESS